MTIKSLLSAAYRSRRNASILSSVFGIFLSASAVADTWSPCVHITSVAEWPNGIVIGIPDLPQQCNLAGTGTLWIQQGQGPAGYAPTVDSMKGLRAQALLAKITGQKVMIYFNESNLAACYVGIIALGGYAMQCN